MGKNDENFIDFFDELCDADYYIMKLLKNTSTT